MARVGDRCVHVWERPAAGAVPVVLAFHGLTDGGIVYGPTAQAITDRCVFLAPDAPGHGCSHGRLPRRYSAEALLPLDLDVLDEIPDLVAPHRPVVVVGHSMGAVEAAALAARRPDVVRHAVLEEPPGPSRAPGVVYRLQQWIFLQRVRHATQERADQFTGHADDWSTAELEVWARSKRETDGRVLLRLGNWDSPISDLVSTIACPVTMVFGADDEGETSPQRMADLDALGPRVQIRRLDGAGHNPRREAPTQFQDILRQVLDGIGDSASAQD